MRHPNNGQSEGDLSRLTGTSSTSSTPSSSNDNLDIENNDNNLCNDSCAIISSQALILSVNDNENANNLKNSQHIHGHHHHHHHHHGHHHHHHGHHHHHHSQNHTTQQQGCGQHQQHYPSYLPEYIDPLEWQKSRKRKERLDSTSSTTQVDRKLQRSNSEELITSSDCEVIRRVSSHEDFKKQPKPLQEKNTNIECSEDSTNNLKTIAENENHSVKSVKSYKNAENQQSCQQQPNESANNFVIRLRLDTSPARSNTHRWSPNRFDDSSENENERRRSSERFSKTRAPPGRKSGIVKKVGSNSSGGGGKVSRRSGDENAYKYDISHLKYERRGFVSKLKLEEHRKEEAADGEPILKASSANLKPSAQTNDYNDNNLIDLCLQKQHQQQQAKPQQQQQKNINGGMQILNVQQHQQPQQKLQQQQQHQQQQQPQHNFKNPDASTTAIPLPWDHSPQDIESTPVLCRRFASSYNSDDESQSSQKTSSSTNNNNNNNNQYCQHYSGIINNLTWDSSSPAIIAAPAVIVDNEPIKSFRTFTKMENLKTREAMLQQLPLGLMQTPEERLKVINKKMNALKKKVTLLEENYEKTYGYRPSQIERYNDKQIKCALAEINKLRKEKQEIKTDPMAAFGLKVSGSLDAQQKLSQMKDTLEDIQSKLTDKRGDSNRSENLDTLTSDQLVQEKTAVQHSLLYFESLYGRPSTREERDAARPLYDRYRIIKRMITRSISIPPTGGVGCELPTILEHEAMTYETIQQQSSISTDTTTNSLSDHLTAGTSNMFAAMMPSSASTTTVESPSDNSAQSTTTESTSESSNQFSVNHQQQQRESSSSPAHQSANDVNLHMLSLDELWGHLERVREEKKDLKKSIRDFENIFEEQNGRKMLKNDRKLIEETYAAYKENKAKVRLLQALIKKQMAK